jgi:hypothetical protein
MSGASTTLLAVKALADFFNTTNRSFALILAAYGLGTAIYSYLLAVPFQYAALTIFGPFVVWWLGRRDQKATLTLKDGEIQALKDREERTKQDVFRVTAHVRESAARLPYHVGLGYGAGQYSHFGELSPSRIPSFPEYAALRGKAHEAHLWVESWMVSCRRAHEPGARQRGYLMPERDTAMREAGAFKDQVMEECERLEQKALRGELPRRT